MIKIEITNNTDLIFKKKTCFSQKMTWDFPDELNPQETTEGLMEFNEVSEDCRGLIRYVQEEERSFQLFATSKDGNHIEVDTSFNIESDPSGNIPIIDQTVISFVFSEVPEKIQREIIQKKGELCSSKKDAKKAKESKSKGKRLT